MVALGRTITPTASLVGALATLALLAPVAAAGAGGAVAPSSSASPGGAEYGSPLKTPKPPRPVATLFRVSPTAVTAGRRLPTVSFRVDEKGTRVVRARLVLQPVHGQGRLLRVDLGRVRTGKRHHAAWPHGTRLAAGSYVVRLHVKDARGATLLRRAHTSGRTALVVKAAPRPKVKPVPPVVAPVVPTPKSDGGVFPVQGPHSFGADDARFGAGRPGHIHEGQDIVAASGLPVVAPLAGTITARRNQPSAAGYYVVETLPDGRAFFFAHCQKDSWAVQIGDSVTAGQQLCRVGMTGSATGPHLHFEIWSGNWRLEKGSRPVDPLPQLLAWDRG